MNLTESYHLRLPWMTLCIIIINIMTYGWMGEKVGHIGTYDEIELMSLGGNVAALSLTGDYNRLLYNIFLHGSLLHLGQNMFALLLIGSTLESLLKRWQWLAIYMFGGIFSSFMSAAINFDREQVSILGQVTKILYVSVGASGAIMALAGAELGLALGFKLSASKMNKETAPTDKRLRSALLIPFMALVYGFLDRETDNVAHIAGFFFGLFSVIPIIAIHFINTWQSCLILCLCTFCILGFSGSQYGRVANHPEREELRQLALWELKETQRVDDLHRRLTQERRNLLPHATVEQAIGIDIPIPFVGRMVPTTDLNRVFLLKNYNKAQIIEYDLARNVPIRTLIDQPYAGNDLWGCPNEQCFGVGVSDLQLDEAVGKAYASGLVKGAVSRIDLASGRIDWTTKVSKFPSRLLFRKGRLYSLDRVDNSLVIIDAEKGNMLSKVQLPGDSDNWYRWPTGETLMFSSQGDALYLLAAGGHPLRMDLTSNKVTVVGKEGAEQMGRDSQGHLWLLYEDEIFFPELNIRRENLFFRMEKNTSHRYVNITYLDDDGLQPLILHLEDNFVMGSSGYTGQLLRLYPLIYHESTQLYLQALDSKRFYVSGRESTQLLNVGTALPVAGIGDNYQKQLSEQPQWMHNFQRREPPVVAP